MMQAASAGISLHGWKIRRTPGKMAYGTVYGDAGQILYMHGESVMVTGIDEQQKLVSMLNRQNTERYEGFMIPFSQFTRDFGMWPPADI